jgi:hypothetical protein
VKHPDLWDAFGRRTRAQTPNAYAGYYIQQIPTSAEMLSVHGAGPTC